MEGKMNYREIAKKYVEWGTKELKQKLLDKKGKQWMDEHWAKLNKARGDLIARPPNDMKETIQTKKEEEKLGANAAQRVDEVENTLQRLGNKMKDAINTAQATGGRLTQTKSELFKEIEALKKDLLEEREERKRMQKQIEKQQEQIERLLKAVGIEKE